MKKEGDGNGGDVTAVDGVSGDDDNKTPAKKREGTGEMGERGGGGKEAGGRGGRDEDDRKGEGADARRNVSGESGGGRGRAGRGGAGDARKKDIDRKKEGGKVNK